MYAPGHVGLALLVCAPLVYWRGRARRPRDAVVAVVTALAFATSPDVDLLVVALTHRGLSHTVWAAVVVGACATVAWALLLRIAAATGATRWGRSPRLAAATSAWAGGATVTSHLLGDLLTPMGIRPFAPLVGTTYSLALVAARDPATNRALFLAGVLAMTLALHQGRRAAAADRPTDADQPIAAD